jgi:hypothetical protein
VHEQSLDMNGQMADTLPMSSPASLSLRPAGPRDEDVVRDLAALDSARPLTGPTLLAYSGDRAVAAVSLSDGRVVADPFTPSADAVALLRLRARQGDHRDRRPRRRVLRFVTA